jgi:hypothetical protein
MRRGPRKPTRHGGGGYTHDARDRRLARAFDAHVNRPVELSRRASQSVIWAATAGSERSSACLAAPALPNTLVRPQQGVAHEVRSWTVGRSRAARSRALGSRRRVGLHPVLSERGGACGAPVACLRSGARASRAEPNTTRFVPAPSARLATLDARSARDRRTRTCTRRAGFGADPGASGCNAGRSRCWFVPERYDPPTSRSLGANVRCHAAHDRHWAASMVVRRLHGIRE